MKEESVILNTSIEWIPFSKHSPPEHVFQMIMAAISNLKDNQSIWNSPVIGVICIALLSFLAGWMLRDD